MKLYIIEGDIMKWINKDVIYAFSLLGYLSLVMIGNILVCIVLYKLIERYIFKSTILFIILVLVGVVSGFYSCYKLIMKK